MRRTAIANSKYLEQIMLTPSLHEELTIRYRLACDLVEVESGFPNLVKFLLPSECSDRFQCVLGEFR